MSEIEKYKSGELAYWTSIDGSIWHSDKVVQQLKAENEKLRFPREDIDFAVLTKEEFENYNKLKATLNEIEEIITNNISYMDTSSTTHAMEEILRKIKEVKGE